jgi:hypothetical protein
VISSGIALSGVRVGLARRDLPGASPRARRDRCEVDILLSAGRRDAPRRRHLGRASDGRQSAGLEPRLHDCRRGTGGTCRAADRAVRHALPGAIWWRRGPPCAPTEPYVRVSPHRRLLLLNRSASIDKSQCAKSPGTVRRIRRSQSKACAKLPYTRLCLPGNPFGKVQVSLFHHPTQCRAIEAAVVHNPPAHHRVDPLPNFLKGNRCFAFQPPVTHRVADRFGRFAAGRWEKVQKNRPIFRQRLAGTGVVQISSSVTG